MEEYDLEELDAGKMELGPIDSSNLNELAFESVVRIYGKDSQLLAEIDRSGEITFYGNSEKAFAALWQHYLHHLQHQKIPGIREKSELS